VTAALVCLGVGLVAGCTDGGGTEEQSAEQILDHANDTMKALTSVTIEGNTTVTGGEGSSIHVTTNLKDRCTTKGTWDKGAKVEQIRIGGTAYIRGNPAFAEKLPARNPAVTTDPKRWTEIPSSEAKASDGLAHCTQEFTSFGVAKKGEATRVDGKPAISLLVTDKAEKGSSYVFHVAADGEPYILKVEYRSASLHTTTSFSAFNKPLDVTPPATDEVLDASGIGH
jgi:hypothetical protein